MFQKLSIKPNIKVNNTKGLKYFIAVLALIIIAQTFIFFVFLNDKDENNSLSSFDEQNQELIEKLSSMILLPDSDPAIYQINDIEKVRKSYGDFFKDAKEGDKLILYSDKAIIYRQSEQLIINVGPVLMLQEDTGTENSAS